MSQTVEPTDRIRELVASGHYRLGLHAVRHMVEEGFDEAHLVAAIRGRLVLVEDYADEDRHLVLGHFHFSLGARSPLHLVCEFPDPDFVDIVTAYIPQSPWWASPTQRGTHP